MKKIFYIIILLSLINVLGFSKELALVDVKWLEDHLQDDNLVILDVRSERDYKKAHIPQSVHTDYKKWRTEKNGLPGFIPENKEYLEDIVSSTGITTSSHVVIVSGVDEHTDFGTAARVYWTLKLVGLNNLSILDGGFNQWERNNLQVSDTPHSPTPSQFTIHEDYLHNKKLLATEAVVQEAVKNHSSILMDARPEDFFLGHKKQIFSRISGTIKDSINISQFDFLNEDGTLKSKDEIASIIKSHNLSSKETPIITFCNTGHWAATNWFVLSEIMGHNTSMYDGSLVEWTANDKNPVINEKPI